MTTRFSFWLFLFVGLAALGSGSAAWGQATPAPKTKTKPAVTTVFLVRHAEKDSTSDRADPTLSPVGQVRAQALNQTLARRHPDALFTTDTKRTRATLAPLAAALKLEPQVYEGRRTYALAERIQKEYAGKTVVVVGHSDSILPLINELGGTAPVDEINESDYEYLFTVRLVAGAMPTVEVRGYGPEHKAAPTAKAQSKSASASTRVAAPAAMSPAATPVAAPVSAPVPAPTTPPTAAPVATPEAAPVPAPAK
jgi:phosphohistidine phosphatase SixA